MYCNNCGKKIDANSKFCQFCGVELKKIDTENSSAASSTDFSETKPEEEVRLWDKFKEIYTSRDEERKKYEELSSNEVWELIQRISNNTFEDFIKANKDLLNKQPYKVIETLKNVFALCASGGYWLWMAEAFLKDENLTKPKNIALDNFIKEWQENIKEKYDEHSKSFSKELGQAMADFNEYELSVVLDSSDSVKDLPNELIEKIRNSLILQVMSGYMGGLTEKEYRK